MFIGVEEKLPDTSFILVSFIFSWVNSILVPSPFVKGSAQRFELRVRDIHMVLLEFHLRDGLHKVFLLGYTNKLLFLRYISVS